MENDFNDLSHDALDVANQQSQDSVDLGSNLYNSNQNPLQIEPASYQEINPAPIDRSIQSIPEPPQTQQGGSLASGLQDQFQLQARAIDEQKKANQLMAQAQASGLQSQANVYEKLGQDVNSIDQKYAPIEADLNAKNKTLQDAILNQKINPNRVWQNMSTGNKILAGISVALSGIGAGLQGHGAPNAALQVIEREIDRDVDSQVRELGKKQTLLSDNLRQLGDMRAARAATKAQLISAAQAQAQGIAARSGSKEAMARVGLLNSQADLQKQQLNMQAKLYSALVGESNGNPEGLISYLRIQNPAMAKEIEERYVPRVGIASIPVPDKIREELASRQTLQEQVHQLRMWAKDHSGSLNPEDIAYGKALSNSVQDAYRSVNGQGVFRPAEAEFVKGIVEEDPTKFLNSFRVDPKYKALEDSNLLKLNGLKKSYGLPQQTAAQALNPQEQQYLSWARKNPNDPRAKLVFQKLGVQ